MKLQKPKSTAVSVFHVSDMTTGATDLGACGSRVLLGLCCAAPAWSGGEE